MHCQTCVFIVFQTPNWRRAFFGTSLNGRRKTQIDNFYLYYRFLISCIFNVIHFYIFTWTKYALHNSCLVKLLWLMQTMISISTNHKTNLTQTIRSIVGFIRWTDSDDRFELPSAAKSQILAFSNHSSYIITMLC